MQKRCRRLFSQNAVVPVPCYYSLELRWGLSRKVVAYHTSVAQVAQIFGGVNTLSGSVRTESVSAEFSTTASEPWLRLHVTVEE